MTSGDEFYSSISLISRERFYVRLEYVVCEYETLPRQCERVRIGRIGRRLDYSNSRREDHNSSRREDHNSNQRACSLLLAISASGSHEAGSMSEDKNRRLNLVENMGALAEHLPGTACVCLLLAATSS